MFSFIVVEKKQNTNKKTKQVLLVTGGWHGSRIRIYDISNIKDSKLYQAHQIAIEYSLSDTEYREYWNHGCIVLSDKLCIKQLDCSMTAPRKYVCHRCNLQGHWMKECPTIGDPNFDKNDKNDDTDGDGNGDGKDKKNMNDISYCWREIKFLLFGGFHNKPFDQSFVIVTSYFRARKEKRSAKGLSKKSLQIKTKFDKIIPQFCDKSKDITKYYGFSMQQINNKHYLLFGGSVSNDSTNNCYSDCIFSLKINDDDIIENQSHKSQTRITFEQLNWKLPQPVCYHSSLWHNDHFHLIFEEYGCNNHWIFKLNNVFNIPKAKNLLFKYICQALKPPILYQYNHNVNDVLFDYVFAYNRQNGCVFCPWTQ